MAINQQTIFQTFYIEDESQATSNKLNIDQGRTF